MTKTTSAARTPMELPAPSSFISVTSWDWTTMVVRSVYGLLALGARSRADGGCPFRPPTGAAPWVWWAWVRRIRPPEHGGDECCEDSDGDSGAELVHKRDFLGLDNDGRSFSLWTLGARGTVSRCRRGSFPAAGGRGSWGRGGGGPPARPPALGGGPAVNTPP